MDCFWLGCSEVREGTLRVPELYPDQAMVKPGLRLHFELSTMDDVPSILPIESLQLRSLFSS